MSQDEWNRLANTIGVPKPPLISSEALRAVLEEQPEKDVDEWNGYESAATFLVCIALWVWFLLLVYPGV